MCFPCVEMRMRESFEADIVVGGSSWLLFCGTYPVEWLGDGDPMLCTMTMTMTMSTVHILYPRRRLGRP